MVKITDNYRNNTFIEFLRSGCQLKKTDRITNIERKPDCAITVRNIILIDATRVFFFFSSPFDS